ncbi:aminodeoxychorismate synthase component I [Marinobacter sp. M216]|uniref:Aminodeoxychorismate synthase component I n=1 Tax=Marinobacter albus TaxID=3030833 RepID=A0ABT7HCJ0_9GAMM|nr:aminodeoxychorismate synthase component I [Marinobacter sp. M216]MDK9557734.1 aminodeoxychorismate synthase component I [Marinobacter sp. M216]
MTLSVTTPISEHQYKRLLTHASKERDFVYVGSVGAGEARGSFSGFSATASESRILFSPDAGPAEVKTLIADMESIVSDFELRDEGNKQCLKGGWIGFLSYELGYAREAHLTALCPRSPVPLVSAGFYLWTASYNRKTEAHYLWVHPQCPARVREKLDGWLSSEPVAIDSSWAMPSCFRPRQSPEAFKASVEAICRYIEAGDCYQANLSQEFVGRYQGEPWTAFQALAEANPTPYSAFIRAGDDAVLSISPERFLEIDGNTITTSPIKGTRARGTTPEEDRALAEELEASDKDRAENLMIVDLLRNDLSLNSATGSVIVDKLFALESYRNVHHLVSHIHARLAPGVTPLKALFDAFPGGSITGAPKIRAMEIIRELEPHWRGPYCGSVFYRGLDGTLDSNIAIRTMLCQGDGTIRCWGGGGIVSDSEPESEYQETLTKVRPLMEFLENL